MHSFLDCIDECYLFTPQGVIFSPSKSRISGERKVDLKNRLQSAFFLIFREEKHQVS